MQVFQDGFVLQAHRLLYHSTLGLRVIKKKRKGGAARITHLRKKTYSIVVNLRGSQTSIVDLCGRGNRFMANRKRAALRLAARIKAHRLLFHSTLGV